MINDILVYSIYPVFFSLFWDTVTSKIYRLPITEDNNKIKKERSQEVKKIQYEFKKNIGYIMKEPNGPRRRRLLELK